MSTIYRSGELLCEKSFTLQKKDYWLTQQTFQSVVLSQLCRMVLFVFIPVYVVLRGVPSTHLFLARRREMESRSHCGSFVSFSSVSPFSRIIISSPSLPFGLTACFIIFVLWDILRKNFSDRTLITFDCLLIIIGTVLLAFADRGSRYWSFVFPAFVLASIGNNLLYAHLSISVFKVAPASQSGVVGAILNSALQLGSAVGTAATIAIQTNVDNKQVNPELSYKGRGASLWFLLGMIAIELIAFWIFYKDDTKSTGRRVDEVPSSPDLGDLEKEDIIKAQISE